MSEPSGRTLTADDRMVAWLRETMAEAERIANSAARRAWSPHWEYDRSVREVRDLNNGGTLASIYFPAIGNFVEANDPATVLRRIGADRKLLDDFLAEPHAVLTPGGSTQIYCDADNTPGEPCDCGRDARVQRHVRLLAEAWGWAEETPPGN